MLLIIKAKYDVIEPYYMEGSPEQLAKHVDEPECWKVSLMDTNKFNNFNNWFIKNESVIAIEN